MRLPKNNSISYVVGLSLVLIIGIELIIWGFWIVPIQQYCNQFVETTCQVIYSNYTIGTDMRSVCDSNNNCVNLPHNFAEVITIWEVTPNIFNYTTHYNTDLPFVSLLGGTKPCWYIPDNSQNILSWDQSKCVDVFIPVLIEVVGGFVIIAYCISEIASICRDRGRLTAQQEVTVIAPRTSVEIVNISTQGFTEGPTTIDPNQIINDVTLPTYHSAFDYPPGGPQIEGIPNV